MAHLTTDDGVKLYYEETGSGTPVVFVHEFAGDLRSYEPQVRYFSRRYRCVVYNARGYPSVDAPFQARENFGIVAARSRMLPSVRPLMRR
jgi:pimeloyl-ACP methyl ester carboxylesterase